MRLSASPPCLSFPTYETVTFTDGKKYLSHCVGTLADVLVHVELHCMGSAVLGMQNLYQTIMDVTILILKQEN